MRTENTLVLQATDIELSHDELARLDDMSRLAPQCPDYMMRLERAQTIEVAIADLS